MKILMLTTNSSLMDGINRHILTIAPEINKYSDCEVAVCTVFPRAELVDALEKEGVKTFSLNASSGHDMSVFRSFNKIMREYNPDIIHSHVMALYEKLLLSTFYRSKKYIQTVHGISDKVVTETFHMKLERMLNRIFHIHYNAICYVSNGVRRYLSGVDRKGDYTIYNPLNFSLIEHKQHKLHKLIGVSENTPIIGTSCRFAQVKNPLLFTRVMCRVLQEKENVHAVVIGDGEASIKQDMHNIIDNSNVASRFHFLGYRPDAPDLVSDLNCFVMTSTSEGLPTSLLEAMVSKTPFAMMEGNGGLIDIADLNREKGPIGVVVPVGDVESISKGICNIIDDTDYAVALANNAHEVGRLHFDVENVCKQLYDIYSITVK